MGKKLDNSHDESLLQIEDIHGEGLLTGCCCCGQQFHLFFEDIEEMPLSKVEGHYFYVFICEECKDDLQMLQENGIDNVSYDILWLIQRDLEYELVELEEKEKRAVFKDDRDTILLKLYREIDSKLKEVKNTHD